jgi:hypothetical protein
MIQLDMHGKMGFKTQEMNPLIIAPPPPSEPPYAWHIVLSTSPDLYSWLTQKKSQTFKDGDTMDYCEYLSKQWRKLRVHAPLRRS